MLVSAVRRFNSLSLLVCRGQSSTLLRQTAIVSSKVIEMIADESENDPVVLADKLKLISPSYFQNRSRMEQLSWEEVEKCAQMLQNIEPKGHSNQSSTGTPQTPHIINPYYFKHLFNVEGLSSAAIQGVITQLETNNEGALASKLRQLTPHSSLENLSNESVNQIKQLMTTGVILPSFLRTQERIKNGRNLKGLFTFQPTWMTTTSIFQYLKNKNPSFHFFYGSYGTGKSISFILYCILMGNIAKFAAQTPSQEILSLVKQNAILSPRKPFYWSFSAKEDQKDLKMSILQQSPQINQDQILKKQILKQSFLSFCLSIKRFYASKQIETLLVIDQINALAGMMRKYNRNPKSVSQNWIKNFQKISMEITAVGDNVIYNSSANIQMSLLGNSDVQNPITLEIQTHSKLTKIYIPYQHRIKTEKGQKQCSSFVFFEAKIRNVELSDSDKSKIEEEFKNIPVKTIMKPLTISQVMNSQIKKQTISQQLMEKSIKSLNEYAKRFKKKISESTDQQISDFGIFLLYLMKLLRENKSDDQFVISKEKLKKIFTQLEINQKNQNQFLDRNLFFQHNGSYQSLASPAYLEQFLASDLLSSFTLKHIKLTFEKFNIKKKSQPEFGCLYEYIFLKSFQNKFSIDPNTVIDISFGKYKKLPVRAIKKFVEFNDRKTKNRNQKGNMDEIFLAAKQNPQGYFLGLPVLRSTNRRSRTSYCVDFCLVNYNQASDMFKINFFDLKTGSSLSKTQKNVRALDFKKRLRKSIGLQKYQVTINVVCEQSAFPTKPQDFPEIKFIDITAVEVENLLQQDKDILDYLIQQFQIKNKKKIAEK